MNKKEVLEIRKQFTPANCAITRICGCYVDHEKNKVFTSKEAFLSLPEDEEFKYFDIFKHTLSGTVGKNLVTMEFPLDMEAEGGTQDFLMRLKKSKLQEDELLEQFYDKVIESYEYAENYYIVLIHAAYDVPGRTSDGLEMDDASDEVYDFLLCSLCPVKMSKPGLSYNAEKNSIEDRNRDWVVEQPVNGILFPAFTDRSSDIHNVLYYAKNPEILQEYFAEHVLGAYVPLTPATQKESFQTIVSETLGDDGDYELIRNIHENLNEIIEENKENPEPVTMDKNDMKRLLQNSGVPDEEMECFDEVFEEKVGERAELIVTNVADVKKFQIETPDIVIKVNPERADLVETKIIDGRQCLVIAVDDHVEVNGVSVRTMSRKTAEED